MAASSFALSLLVQTVSNRLQTSPRITLDALAAEGEEVARALRECTNVDLYTVAHDITAAGYGRVGYNPTSQRFTLCR